MLKIIIITLLILFTIIDFGIVCGPSIAEIVHEKEKNKIDNSIEEIK